MSTYFIGDIHGCYKELTLLLKKISFDHRKDFLWIVGDLVSRGPNSLEVLRYLYSLKNRVKIVLGNHDLNLIAVYSGVKKNNTKYGFDNILSAKDNCKLINWLRCQSLLKIDEDRKIIMSHAGISPQWDIFTARTCAIEIEKLLSSDHYNVFLKSIYNNNIYFWQSDLNKLDRLKYSINTFTRMRYCHPNSTLDMIYKQSPESMNKPLKPWFTIKSKIHKIYSIFFGHWSTLKDTYVSHPFYSLDTGCCWGGELTVFRWEDKRWFSQKSLTR